MKTLALLFVLSATIVSTPLFAKDSPDKLHKIQTQNVNAGLEPPGIIVFAPDLSVSSNLNVPDRDFKGELVESKDREQVERHNGEN